MSVVGVAFALELAGGDSESGLALELGDCAAFRVIRNFAIALVAGISDVREDRLVARARGERGGSHPPVLLTDFDVENQDSHVEGEVLRLPFALEPFYAVPDGGLDVVSQDYGIDHFGSRACALVVS